MTKKKTPESYLPLSAPVFHVLLALADGEKHGYVISKEIARRTDNEVRLSAGQLLRGGDTLVASDGSLILVRCATQAVTVARPGADAQGMSALLSAAYLLGRDQVAVDARSDRLLMLPDAARGAQLQAQGLVLSDENDAFEPLGDAAQTKPRAAIAIAAAAPAHVHGPGCGHDHHSH